MSSQAFLQCASSCCRAAQLAPGRRVTIQPQEPSARRALQRCSNKCRSPCVMDCGAVLRRSSAARAPERFDCSQTMPRSSTRSVTNVFASAFAQSDQPAHLPSPVIAALQQQHTLCFPLSVSSAPSVHMRQHRHVCCPLRSSTC
jgi:hypothetical protein